MPSVQIWKTELLLVQLPCKQPQLKHNCHTVYKWIAQKKARFLFLVILQQNSFNSLYNINLLKFALTQQIFQWHFFPPGFSCLLYKLWPDFVTTLIHHLYKSFMLIKPTWQTSYLLLEHQSSVEVKNLLKQIPLHWSHGTLILIFRLLTSYKLPGSL